MMKRPIHSVWYSFSILFIMLNMASCRKNAVEPNDGKENYTIGFRFQEFEDRVSPLGTKAQTADDVIKRATAGNFNQNTQESHIYYWSFNAETLMPDIYPSTHWNITYNQGLIPDEYAAGWSYESYVAGRALSLKGLKELIFKMPLTQVLEVHELAFDVSSSGTGPKGFSLLFSQDGESYVVLKEHNQFANTNTPQARNSFTFSLEELALDLSKDLYIKLVPEAGNRGSAGDYNEVTGIVRIDNFRLSGIAEELADASVRRVHYHIFDAATKNLVLSGADHFREGELSDFQLTLPSGDYIASFVTNVSNAALTIPETGNADGYFIANMFANHKAKIFGVVDTFSVDGDMHKEIELSRYYSEIRFAFTDTKDLSHVGKLVIKQGHVPKFYAPFRPAMDSPVQDVSEIVILPEFSDNKELFFNQFIGNTVVPTRLSYVVEAYDIADKLITTFEVESEVRNNMQLLFRGSLLGTPNGGFVVRLNENWSGEKQVGFN
ncbi:hypothetical protein [Sphingobacterium haloxyli]|uniref:Uncharacterized protein n=1 Tax=Sphingobacterium haloxyli TaxID=2100533 RepID=A0A2S9J9B7_9SPHI|nr:hypothetical protein [Sphingobacterium haloxyli]PRD49354.1 hypothetical protein C5745_01665 [Sphingobacterium haloxyli]